jgi:hypothetical protein
MKTLHIISTFALLALVGGRALPWPAEELDLINSAIQAPPPSPPSKPANSSPSKPASPPPAVKQPPPPPSPKPVSPLPAAKQPQSSLPSKPASPAAAVKPSPSQLLSKPATSPSSKLAPTPAASKSPPPPQPPNPGSQPPTKLSPQTSKLPSGKSPSHQPQTGNKGKKNCHFGAKDAYGVLEKRQCPQEGDIVFHPDDLLGGREELAQARRASEDARRVLQDREAALAALREIPEKDADLMRRLNEASASWEQAKKDLAEREEIQRSREAALAKLEGRS